MVIHCWLKVHNFNNLRAIVAPYWETLYVSKEEGWGRRTAKLYRTSEGRRDVDKVLTSPNYKKMETSKPTTNG